MATEMGHARPAATRVGGERVRDEDETSGGMLGEIGWVAWRSLMKLMRNPFLLFFSLFMPLIWLLMFSQTFGTLFARGAAGPGGLCSRMTTWRSCCLALPS